MKNSQSARDMLVRLYDLPSAEPPVREAQEAGVIVRRALAPERSVVLNWVAETFSQAWADECNVALTGHPVRCFVAVADGHLVGVCGYDAVARGVVGPIGLDSNYRGRSVGRALMLTTLHDMRAAGYAYGILGWLEPTEQGFGRSVANAVVIEGSAPRTGMYAGLLNNPRSHVRRAD
jgi:GNAT superfamily N-acetyltransferase